MVTYKRISINCVFAYKGDSFIGSLNKSCRTMRLGLHKQRVTVWEGAIMGNDLHAMSLTKAKAMIAKSGI